MMTYNMDPLPSFDLIVFDKISKRTISSYLLGIVAMAT